MEAPYENRYMMLFFGKIPKHFDRLCKCVRSHDEDISFKTDSTKTTNKVNAKK